MKRFILILIALMAIGSTASAFNYDQALINLWNRRPDLQKAFPGALSNSDKLIEWAEKYGWKETPDLFNYYPDKEIIDRIVDQRVEARIKMMEAQITKLQNKAPEVKTIQTERIIEQVPATLPGRWVKCCGFPNGTFNCKDGLEKINCAEKHGSGAYEIYLLTK